MWSGVCFRPAIEKSLDREKEFKDEMAKDLAKQNITTTIKDGSPAKTKTVTYTLFSATVEYLPQFSIASWEPVPQINRDDGLWENKCWPSAIAPLDPGFVLLAVDPYYGGNPAPYRYADAYDPPNNGA